MWKMGMNISHLEKFHNWDLSLPLYFRQELCRHLRNLRQGHVALKLNVVSDFNTPATARFPEISNDVFCLAKTSF